MIDVLVAGGGPAGLATALYAAQAGLEVVVVEPREPPIDKACGEGLMPAAVRLLSQLVGDLPGAPLRGIRYLDHRRQVDAPFRDGAGLGVRRTVLHQAMHARVRQVGIPVVAGRVTTIRQDDTCVTAEGITARYLVAADGLHSSIRDDLGLTRAERRAPRYGLRRHFVVPAWTDLVEVHWAGTAEAYVTPVAPELVGVALLTSRRGSFEAQLSQFPALIDRLPATASSTSRGAGPLRRRARARTAGRVLLVGDAAGYVDALTGEGIALSMACARSLVRCLAADRPQAYELAWRRDSRRYRLMTEALLLARRTPGLRQSIVPAAGRFPSVFGAVVEQLARG
ncbi:MAG: NAD(P)/FAD-dependent oxidoreductase [Nocardioidaceae bacterium]